MVRSGEVSVGLGPVTGVSEGMTAAAVMVRAGEETTDWLVTEAGVVSCSVVVLRGSMGAETKVNTGSRCCFPLLQSGCCTLSMLPLI